MIAVKNDFYDPIVQYTVISRDGTVLSEKKIEPLENISINLLNFGKGIYLIRFRSSNSEIVREVAVD